MTTKEIQHTLVFAIIVVAFLAIFPQMTEAIPDKLINRGDKVKDVTGAKTCSSCTPGIFKGTDTGFGVPSPISYELTKTPVKGPVLGGGGGGGGKDRPDPRPRPPDRRQPPTGDCGGGSLVSNCGGDDSYTYECPAGYTLYGAPGKCYPNELCTTTGSGKGARKTCNEPPAPPVQPRHSDPIPPPIMQSVPPVVSIGTSPSIVRFGGSSRVTWSGGAADECTVVGYGLSSTAINGSQVVSNIQERTTYTLTCSRGTAVAQDTARVDIVPLWREF